MKKKSVFLPVITVLLSISFASKAGGSKTTEGKEKSYSALSDLFIPADSFITPVVSTLVLPAPAENSNVIPEEAKRPNVIIILADDLDAVYTPQYFSEVLPVVDSLAKVGIKMVNSFTPMSICCPSRSATLTGSYAHNNGVYRNAGQNGGWKAFQHNEPFTLAAQLSRSGYRTSMIGKYLNGWHDPDARPVYGWTDGSVIVSKDKSVYRGYDYEMLVWHGGMETPDSTWQVLKQDREYYGREDQDYSTDVLSAKARVFIGETEKDDLQPFFLYLTPTAPHLPLPAAPRHTEQAKKWKNSFVSPYPNYFSDYGKLATKAEQRKPLDKSSFLRDTWRKRLRQADKGNFWYNMYQVGKSPKEIKSFVQADWNNRMGSLYALNDMVSSLIQTLKEQGEWDNTMLIFTSDNGFMLGAHAMLHKGNPYEPSIRVPLVIAGGDSLQLHLPGSSAAWVTNLDLMPTILNMAGIPISESVDGISLSPILYGDTTMQVRDRFVMEYLGPGMTTEGLVKHPRLLYRILPSYIMDIPSYHAIRMKVQTEENGIPQEKTFKYIEWQKYQTKKVLRFSDRYRIKDPVLMGKIASGDKKTLKLKAKAEEVETELYDLTEDPDEMDNLLYYKPGEYKDLALQLKMNMREIILKK